MLDTFLNNDASIDEIMFSLECSAMEFEIEMRELEFMQEMVAFREHQDLDRATIKVFAEGGTDEDLEYLQTEIFKESKGESEGLFAKIWRTICDMFQSIKNALFGVSNKISPEAKTKTVNVPKTYWNALKVGFHKIAGKIKYVVAAISTLSVVAGLAVGAHHIHQKRVEAKNAGNEELEKLPVEEQPKLSSQHRALLTMAQDTVKGFNEIAENIAHNANAAETVAVSGAELLETSKVIQDVSDAVSKTKNEGWVSKAMESTLTKPLVSCVQAIAKLANDAGTKVSGWLNKLSGGNKPNTEIKDDQTGEVEKVSGTVEHAEEDDGDDGSPTFEAGSIDDVMALIYSL